MDVNLQKRRLIDIIDDFTILENIPSKKIYKSIFKKLINLSVLVSKEKIEKYPTPEVIYDYYDDEIDKSQSVSLDVCPTCRRRYQRLKNNDNRKSLSEED